MYSRKKIICVSVLSFLLFLGVALLNCKWYYTFNINLANFTIGLNERLKVFGFELYQTEMETKNTILSERIISAELRPSQESSGSHYWKKLYEYSDGEDIVIFKNSALLRDFAEDPCVAMHLTAERHIAVAKVIARLYRHGGSEADSAVEVLLSFEMQDCFIY